MRRDKNEKKVEERKIRQEYKRRRKKKEENKKREGIGDEMERYMRKRTGKWKRSRVGR